MSAMTLSEWREKATRLNNRMANLREEKKSEIATVSRIAMGTAVSGALGYVEVAYPERAKVGGFPLSLLVAAVGTAGVIQGWGGAESAIAFESMALGGGCAYGYRFGTEMAQEQSESA